MTCYVKNLFLLTLLLLLPATSLFAMQDGQATVTVAVEDDYTNEPVEAVLVRLLDNGSEIASGTTDLTGRAELVLSVTSTEEPTLIPESFEVSESYPNPFEQSSSVNLQIEEPQEVQAEIYNIIGQRVASLQVNLIPGTYTLQSSLGHLAQGVYFLRILGTQSQTIKMTKVGERIFSGGAILNINPATFVTRNGPGVAGLALNGQTSRSLTLVTSNGSYDTFQQSVQVASDTTIAVDMSRNNEVVVRVADESSPSQNVERSLLVQGDQFSQQITSPDTLTLKSGFYTLSADEDNTEAFSQDVEIASEDQTITVLTQVKTLADNQLQLEGLITEETSGTPINRAYVYLLNQTTSDTLAGPLFAGSDGVLDAIANLDNGPDLDLSILYRKAGFADFSSTASVSLPDTLVLNTSLQAAPPPTASFTVTGDKTAGQPVMFDASASAGASGEDLTYSWDFGNGKRGFGETISHIYTTSINATVTLTVAGDLGATGTATEAVNISRAPNPPSTTIINGEITTVGLEPLEGVTANLVGNDLTSVSGTDGKIVIPELPSGVPIVMQLNKPGYTTQTVRLIPDPASSNNFFTTAMIPVEEPVTIENIENGTDAIGKFGTRVSLPVDGLVDAAGTVVTGDVELSMTPIDVSSDEIFAFPGGFNGLRPTGEQGSLVSFGVADFTFTQNGESLQMMPGKSAEIEIPVTNADVALGDEIPLWTLDEEIGIWVEEGVGEIIASSDSPSGLSMITTTGHFSWKNIDVFFDGFYTLIPQCRNSETSQVISCMIKGTAYNDDGSFFGFSPIVFVPAGGDFIFPIIPVNKRLEIGAFSGNGDLTGTATIPPITTTGEEVNVTIDLTSRENLTGLPIAYGDLLKGKSTISESTRYIFEGEQGDFVRIRVREAIGFEGRGNVSLQITEDLILQEGNYANNFSRYLFEELPETGTYFIDVDAQTETSNFDIELDLFEGPVNRQITYGDRIFDFLWPGTTNTYTFDGQTEEVFELIARNVEGEGTLFADIKLNTPNPLASYETQFFNYNAWVKRLEEKDGIYSFEVSGADDSRHGEYILDLNTINNFTDSGSEIAYGDSIIGKVTESEPNNSLTFEGSAGDRIRLHIDKPYPEEESFTSLSASTSLIAPNSEVLYEFSFGFRFGDEIGFGFILPSDGTYTFNIDADRIDAPNGEGELFSLLLKRFENPTTKDLDDDSIDLNNEVYSTGLNLNEYTFSGSEEDFTRIVVRSTDGGNQSRGNVKLFDENYQFLLEDGFTGGRSGTRSVFDFETSVQKYTVIVTNPGRIQESDGRVAYAVNKNDFNGGLIEFNTPLSTTLEPDEFKVFSFKNELSVNEVSIAALGFDDVDIPVYIVDPKNNRPRLFFSGSQSYAPTILRERTNYLLYTEQNNSANAIPIQLSVVSLRPPSIISFDNTGPTTVEGTIRVNGDIDRFNLRDYFDGTMKVSILPAELNSIENSGNLKIRIQDASDSIIAPDFEGPSPDGPELYIWEGRIGTSVRYFMSIWDQSATLTGDFIIKVEFTTSS